ncbi:MAG: type II secretion system protein [Patescibacteria group bacterium]
MLNKKTKINTKGFTLIEIMVAVSIFALVMVVAIGAVLSIVSANKKSQAVSSVLTNLNFALEAMVRDLRTGYNYSCDGGGDCTGFDGLGGGIISFISTQSNLPVEYTIQNDGIVKSVDGGNRVSLTSPDVKITSLKFYVVGTKKTVAGDYIQPRIIITIAGNYNGFGNLAEFHLQTMVSQRRIDI